MFKLSKNKPKRAQPKVYLKRILAIVALSFGQLVMPFLSLTTNADPTRTKIARYEALRVLTEKCSKLSHQEGKGIDLKTEISADEYRDASFSPLTNDADGELSNLQSGSASVSNVLFSEINGGKTDLSCAKALSLYYETKYEGASLAEKRQAFIKDFYDTSSQCNYAGTLYFRLNGFPCNDGDGSMDGDTYDGVSSSLLRNVHSYMLSLIQGDRSSFDLWTNRIISYAFNECYKFQPKNPAEDNPDRKAAENWVIQNNNASSNAVGWMAEVQITGSYTDGRIGCDEVKNYIFPNHTDLIGFSDDDLKDELQTEATEKAALEIYNKLSEDPNIMIACAAANGISTSSLNSSQVASWLAFDDSDHPFPIQPPPESSALSTFKNCLLENIPEIQQTLSDLDEELGTISDNVDSATEAQEQAKDDCLQKSDAFIAWAACPIVNLVDSFLEFVENMIQSFLQFDLDKQDETGGLKNAWNVFRSLATTLIVAGFLLALVVKGVKGE